MLVVQARLQVWLSISDGEGKKKERYERGGILTNTKFPHIPTKQWTRRAQSPSDF